MYVWHNLGVFKVFAWCGVLCMRMDLNIILSLRLVNMTLISLPSAQSLNLSISTLPRRVMLSVDCTVDKMNQIQLAKLKMMSKLLDQQRKFP